MTGFTVFTAVTGAVYLATAGVTASMCWPLWKLSRKPSYPRRVFWVWTVGLVVPTAATGVVWTLSDYRGPWLVWTGSAVSLGAGVLAVWPVRRQVWRVLRGGAP